MARACAGRGGGHHCSGSRARAARLLWLAESSGAVGARALVAKAAARGRSRSSSRARAGRPSSTACVARVATIVSASSGCLRASLRVGTCAGPISAATPTTADLALLACVLRNCMLVYVSLLQSCAPRRTHWRPCVRSAAANRGFGWLASEATRRRGRSCRACRSAKAWRTAPPSAPHRHTLRGCVRTQQSAQ